MTVLGKCRDEEGSERLYNHLQAMKTYLLVSLIQQNTLAYQIRDGQIVEGELEEHLVENCLQCTGESKRVLQKLSKLLKRYENSGTNSMEFRVDATRIIHKLDKYTQRFNQIIKQLDRS